MATPCLVAEFIAGETELKPVDLGTTSARWPHQIHSVDMSNLGFLPRKDASAALWLGDRSDSQGQTGLETHARELLEATWPLLCVNCEALLWAFGAAAMDEFTQQYGAIRSGLDLSCLPYWNLCAALGKGPAVQSWGLTGAREMEMQLMRRLFIKGVIACSIADPEEFWPAREKRHDSRPEA